jgi:hypothetical protein
MIHRYWLHADQDGAAFEAWVVIHEAQGSTFHVEATSFVAIDKQGVQAVCWTPFIFRQATPSLVRISCAYPALILSACRNSAGVRRASMPWRSCMKPLQSLQAISGRPQQQHKSTNRRLSTRRPPTVGQSNARSIPTLHLTGHGLHAITSDACKLKCVGRWPAY